MRPASLATVALTILAALALVACGGDDEPSGQPIAPVAAEPEPTPADPEPGAAPADPATGIAPEAPTGGGVDPAPEPTDPIEPAEPSEPQGTLADIALEEVAVLEQPLDLAARPGDERLYIAEKTGRVRVVSPDGAVADAPFLDLSQRVSTNSERGLLGIVFSPDGARFFAHYSDQAGSGHLASWAVSGDGLDPASEIDHLVVEQPFPNHNGGRITFGPDGFLYWGLGDGGAAGDPEETGQDTSRLLGSILRIDPLADGAETYRSPADNPFVGDGTARPEIWVWGLRNPWKFSFASDGGLWIGDVGQDALEEIDFLPAGEAAGANLGWDALEGTAPFEGDAPADAIPPVFEYSHDVGLSVTGGFVYEGAAIPALAGRYVFGDFVTGFVATLTREEGGFRAEALPVEVSQLASFGEDNAGELYALSLTGPVYRLVSR